MIRACAVLHDMAQRNGVPPPALLPIEEGPEAQGIKDEGHTAVILREQVMRHL